MSKYVWKPVTCYGCKKILGMNLPDVTPGPIHHCYECVPVSDDPQEIIDMFENFLNPPKERAIDG